VSLFSLEIKVEGFCSTDNSCRKVYTKGCLIKWDVKVGSFSFDMLLASLCSEFQWSNSQSPSVWFYDKRIGEDVKLENNFQMHDLFEMYKDQMHCEVVVGIFDSSCRGDDDFDDLEPICAIPPDENPDDNNPNSKDIPPGNPAAEPNEPEPQPEPEFEPDREPDMFDNAEEYVGIDDEALFMPSAQAANNAESSNNAKFPSFHDANEFDGVADAEGDIPPEAEVNDADP